MENIIQDVKITKYINSNPPEYIKDDKQKKSPTTAPPPALATAHAHSPEIEEYLMMITFHNIVYITTITVENFKSSLFDLTMLETLIYNCNHNQQVGDVKCNMKISETDNPKALNILLLFTRDVKPMKTINEQHSFKLHIKTMNYDDKICVSMANLRSEINFTTIKPTTKIYTYEIVKISSITELNCRLLITSSNLYLPLLSYHHNSYVNNPINLYTITSDNALTEQVFNTNATYKTVISKTNLELLELFDDKIKTFVNYKTDFAVYKKFTEYIFETYFIINDTEKKTYRFLYNKLIKKLLQLDTHFIDNIIINDNKIITFVDTTKKSNNRNIKYYANLEEFMIEREQFKTYSMLFQCQQGYLFEEFK